MASATPAPAITITHIKHIPATVKPRYTETHTRTVTVTLADDTASSLSRSLDFPMTHISSVPHGVIPGSPRSPSLLRSPTTSTPALSRRSTYPRPSPPGFLYPHAIVPRAAYEIHDHANMSSPASNALPYGLEVLIFGAVLLGIAWTLLVVLINFPPRTWGRKKAKRRPLVKPSKYVKATGTKETDEGVQATTSWAQKSPIRRPTHESIEVRKRHTPTPTHVRAQSNPAIRFAMPPRSPREPSPPNPFLRPLTTGTSTSSVPPATPDWLAGHAAFFSSASSSTSSDDYDVAALEAGTAPLMPWTLKTHERKGSWVDLGLGQVEDAVSGFVGRVVRWTDEDGGMVLPVVNTRGGDVRA